jgi:tripartite-type tricarboxylate transporter receptor subunit TctC
MKRRLLIQALLGLTSAAGLRPALAQATATKLLVGAPPGGGTDILARTLGNEMGMHGKQTFIVENRPGAAGNLAAISTAKSVPDGSTLLLSYTSHVINPSLFKKPPFDALADFTPIAPIAKAPSILVVSPSCPANTLPELIALVKSKPHKMNIAIAGIGSANHLAGEMLRKRAALDIVSVPYKGTSAALTDLMAGQVDIVLSGYGAAGGLIKAGKLKALAVTSEKPMPSLPGVPAIATVFPGFDYSAWYGVFGPAGMKDTQVQFLRQAIAQALQSPELRAQLEREGMTPLEMTPAQFRQFLTTELAHWKEAVAVSGVELM